MDVLVVILVIRNCPFPFLSGTVANTCLSFAVIQVGVRVHVGGGSLWGLSATCIS